MAGNFEFNIDANAQGAINAANQVGNAFGKAINQVNQDLNQLTNQQRTVKLSIEAQGLDRAAKQLQKAREELSLSAKRSNDVKLKQQALGGVFSSNSKKLSQQVQYLTDYRNRMASIQRPSENVRRTIAGIDRNIQQGNRSLAQMRTGVKGVSGESRTMAEQFAGAGVAANLITQAINGATAALGQFIQTGLKMELLMLQLEGFTGSTEKARETFEQFKKIAVQTPLNVSQVAQAGKILLAFGVETDTATDALRRLAILAGATGSDIGLLSRNLGQVSANGRAFTRDLVQFGTAGIPIMQELSRVTGLYGEDLQKAVEAGAIGFPEVMQAITNLTDETSAFAKIAEKMNNTFTGVFEELTSEVQDFAGTLVIGFNEFDEAIGGVIKGTFKAFSAALRSINKNADVLKQILVPLTAFMAALGVATLVVLGATGKLAVGFGILTAAVMKFSIAKAAAVALQAAWVVLSNPLGFTLVAAAAVAASVAWNQYGQRVQEASDRVEGHRARVEKMTGEAVENWSALSDEVLAGGEDLDAWAGALAEATKNAIKDKEDLVAQQAKVVEKIREQQEAVNDLYDDEKGRIQEKIDELQREIDKYAESRDKRIEAANEAHDEEMRLIAEKYDEDIRRQEEALGILRKRGPEAEKLAQMERRALQNKIASGELDGIELQRARARLERMTQQEKIQKAQAELDKTRAARAEEQRVSEEKKKQEIRESNDAYKTQTKLLEQNIEANKAQIEALEIEQKNFNKSVDDSVDKYTNNLKPSIENVSTAIDGNISEMIRLHGEIDIATTKANNLASALADVISKQKQAEGGKQGGPKKSNFAGGPIKGGEKTYINEIGQEAFLSSSGKLSMIDAAPWSVWKAPSSGTIIPAHIAQGMNIPSGGVKTNKGASANASSAGRGGVSSLMRSMNKGKSGDVFNQSVTIQAANPQRVAQDAMVQLAKLRRTRYS